MGVFSTPQSPSVNVQQSKKSAQTPPSRQNSSGHTAKKKKTADKTISKDSADSSDPSGDSAEEMETDRCDPLAILEEQSN